MLKQKLHLKRFVAATCLSLMCLVSGGPLLANSAIADGTSIQSVAQSYNAASSLQTGLIVQVTNKQNTSVAAATYSAANKMFGVTVASTAAPVTLSNSSTTGSHQVYVASNGQYETLVSNEAGVINVGDYVTISSLSGVGMKAGGSDTQILGRAAGAFDGRSGVASTASLRDQNGRKVNVAIGRIPVDISIGANPLVSKDGGYVPSLLQKSVDIVTSKPVSPWRIYSALIILLAAIVTGASLIYSGTKSSMIAVGRNPLARNSIMRNLSQIMITSLIVILVGLFGAYVLLKV